MTEFIENPADKATKQDCELKAFYRLAERLKARFPRLPILLSMDGLFAGGPTFSLCRRYGWKFMIVLKDDDLPSVNEEFDALSKLRPENRLVWRTGKQAQVKQVFRWVDDIAYGDSEKKEHPLSAIECLKALERLTPLYIKQGVGMASFAGNPVVFILCTRGQTGSCPMSSSRHSTGLPLKRSSSDWPPRMCALLFCEGSYNTRLEYLTELPKAAAFGYSIARRWLGQRSFLEIPFASAGTFRPG